VPLVDADPAPLKRTPRSDSVIAIGGYSCHPRRRYTDDFKSQAITLAGSIGPAAAARHLGISVKSLTNWPTPSRSGQPLYSSQRQPTRELESELSRLRAENATHKMECDILKKATVFFAKDSK
jgi:transposase